MHDRPRHHDRAARRGGRRAGARRSRLDRAGAVITGRVQVGSGAVIGANSLVSSNVPENAVVVGVPARVWPTRARIASSRAEARAAGVRARGYRAVATASGTSRADETPDS